VHEVLAKFWQQRGSQELLAMSQKMLVEIVEQAAGETLISFNAENDGAFSDAFLALEVERLTKLVLAWLLEVEMLRPQGFVVIACEQEQTIDIEGISIKLIVDRIDTLDDGRLLVLDYKTGSQLDFKNWAQPNITEPQLPIYAAFVLADSEVAAVCFAKLRIADNAFVGVAAADGLVQGATVLNDNRGRKIFPEADFPDWPSLMQHWKKSITQIAQALKSGDAAVRFDDEKQLAYCEVLPLLRLPERQLQYERQQATKPV
jgi:exodeoxyribonuclease-5